MKRPKLIFTFLFQQMIGICLLALVTCGLAAITQSPLETATHSTAITINPKLRKALLEALSNYEGDESTEADSTETTTNDSTEDYEYATNSPYVKIHTFAVDGDKSDENEIIKTIIITRPKTTLTPPRDPSNDISERQDRVQINFNRIPDPVSADDSDNTDNIQLVRSVESRNSAKTTGEKKEEKASEKSVTKPITPQTTTTTTLPPPVTNADGENIEKVAKEDVNIVQAPLLAAFTVQQDLNGQPKKVIQLFKNPQQELNTKKIINMEFKPSQPVQTTLPTSAPTTTLQVPTTVSNSQLPPEQRLLTTFELKQRQLEEQIRFLQARQREQDEIIRRHQLLQDQQSRQQTFEQQRLRFDEEQRQRNRFEEEQRQRQRFEQEQQQLQRQQQAQVLQTPQNQPLIAPPADTPNVQFIPSIPLSHTVGISVEQQLPFKGPVEFNPDNPEKQKPFSQLQQNFQFRQQFQNPFNQAQQQIQQHQVQQIQVQQNKQQQNPFNQPQIQQLQLINPFSQQQQRNAGFQLPNAQPLIQQQQVREIPVAASPLPSNLELPVRPAQQFVQFTALPTTLELPQKPFQTFNSAPLSVLPSLTEIAPQGQQRTRVFRNDQSQTGNFGFNSNFQIQQQQIDPINYSVDNQLQNLLRQSGINTRSTPDDFRIISKILSSNHGIPNNFFQPNLGRF